jgi:RNA polymerase sigma-70 factor (ECF subfamily)
MEEGELRALKEGDLAAVRAFHAACFRPLYTFCYYRLGRDHHATEEVVQETLVLGLKRIADYEPRKSDIHTWLAWLARNGIRHANAERRRFVVLEPGHVEAAEPPDEEPPLETAELVGVALERLPEHYRTVLEKKYVRGESVRSIAESTATSEQAVQSLLARARDAFRRAFEGVAGARAPGIKAEESV